MNVSAASIGLRDADLDFMERLFQKVPVVDSVLIYGSRGRGRFRGGSDIDLALVGAEITSRDWALINLALEDESLIPFFFDVVHYDTISNEVFRAQIDQDGKVLYQKEALLRKAA